MSKEKVEPNGTFDSCPLESHVDQGTQNQAKFKPKFRLGPALCSLCVCLILVFGLAKWIYHDEPILISSEPMVLPKARAWPDFAFQTKPKLYLNIQGPYAKSFEPYVSKTLAGHGFQLVETPAQAEGIVQIAIFYLGSADVAKCRLAVSQGYAAKVYLRGKSCLALLCDLLVVEREIAQERNERQTNLATISNRHIKGSLRERVGVIVPNTPLTDLPEALALSSAEELTKIVLDRFAAKAKKD
ncbi:MAG: hypothetical protein IJT59_07175 [Desulfovibrionaceae bacterium]|nr:hypothetical protein [Desulfovibrionaceae bacterium]